MHVRVPRALAVARLVAGGLRGHLAPAVVACLGAAAVAGCGTPQASPVEKPRASVETLLEACAKESGEAAIDVLTPPAREELIAAESVLLGCERVLELNAEERPEALLPLVFEDATVASVEVDAGFGSARIEAPTGSTTVELENVGDRWLVSNALGE